MNYSDFINSSSYLKTLLQCQQTDNLFNHLINNEEDVIEIITRLYRNDEFEKLFDSLYKQITNSDVGEKIGVVTNEIIVSEYSGVEKDRANLIILRTENYHYYLINGSISKDANYALPWFKSKIISNEGLSDYDYELTQFLLGDEKYLEIDDEECDDYSSRDVICVWQNDNFYHLVTEDAYDEKQKEEEDDDDEEQNDG